MPTFSKDVCIDEWAEVDIDVTVDDFLSECSSTEIDDLITALIQDGHLPKHFNSRHDAMGVGESFYEEALNKLHGKWNCLSQEEEQLIMNIAKRF